MMGSGAGLGWARRDVALVGIGGPSSLDLSACGEFCVRPQERRASIAKRSEGPPIPTTESGLARQLPSLGSSQNPGGPAPCLVWSFRGTERAVSLRTFCD